nr:mitochondrial import inner membrane translocase subunit TIM44 isoform X1 [Vicugna pacos]
MKESIKKFRDEARKLEESDALQEARRKYRTIESETMRTGEVIRKKLGEITGTVKESLDEVSKSDLGRKIKEGVEGAAKTAKQSAESVSKGGEKLGRTAAFKALSQGVESVKKEIDESVLGQMGPYRRPERLRKRKEFAGEKLKEEKVFEANEEALGVVLHKDSKWYQQWKDFRDNNVVFNRFFEMKMKYDESDNAFIRASRVLTDKVTDLLGGLFSKTEMSEVLTEILRVDPAFDKERFLQQCENDIIPNVLEAMISGELDILKDWCYEATYSQLAHPIQQAKALGLQFHSRILDIDNIDAVPVKPPCAHTASIWGACVGRQQLRLRLTIGKRPPGSGPVGRGSPGVWAQAGPRALSGGWPDMSRCRGLLLAMSWEVGVRTWMGAAGKGPGTIL